jgi:hypothetical protein
MLVELASKSSPRTILRLFVASSYVSKNDSDALPQRTLWDTRLAAASFLNILVEGVGTAMLLGNVAEARVARRSVRGLISGHAGTPAPLLMKPSAAAR